MNETSALLSNESTLSNERHQSVVVDYSQLQTRASLVDPKHIVDDEKDKEAVDFVYLPRSWTQCLPDWLCLLCFRKASLVNMRLFKTRRSKVAENQAAIHPSSSFASAMNMLQEQADQPDYSVFRLGLLLFSVVLAGIGNNVTFVKMGFAMPGYPSFVLYFTTFLYCCIYLAWLCIRGFSNIATSPLTGSPALSSSDSDSDFPPSLFPSRVSSVSNLKGLAEREKQREKRVNTLDDVGEAWTRVYAALRISWASALGMAYLGVGFLVTIGGVASQYSNTHVSGPLQAFMNQITLPLTALFARLFLRHKFTTVEMLGAAIVCGGSLLPVIPRLLGDSNNDSSSSSSTSSTSSSAAAALFGAAAIDSPIWLLLYFLSDIPSAAVNVMEESIFSKYRVDEVHYLLYTNLLSLVGYVLVSPLDVFTVDANPTGDRDWWTIQQDAFRCFFGIHSLQPQPLSSFPSSPFTDASLPDRTLFKYELPPPSTASQQPSEQWTLPMGCHENAFVPVFNFVLCFCVYFYLLAVVVKQESATFQAVANTLVTPASALFFASSFVMGENTVALDSPTIAAMLVIPCGIIVYKWEAVTKKRKEDILPLIARH